MPTCSDFKVEKPDNPDDWLSWDRLTVHIPFDKKCNKEVLPAIVDGRKSRTTISSCSWKRKRRVRINSLPWRSHKKRLQAKCWDKPILTKSDLTLLSRHELRCNSIAEIRGDGSKSSLDPNICSIFLMRSAVDFVRRTSSELTINSFCLIEIYYIWNLLKILNSKLWKNGRFLTTNTSRSLDVIDKGISCLNSISEFDVISALRTTANDDDSNWWIISAQISSSRLLPRFDLYCSMRWYSFLRVQKKVNFFSRNFF